MNTRTPVQIIDYTQFTALSRALVKRRKPIAKDGYEIWARYHEALCKVAKKIGKVSDEPDDEPDFYDSGDWFHEHADGFAIYDTRVLSPDTFRKFQAVVASHHPDASMVLEGDMLSPLCGLSVEITPTEIYVAWDEESSDGCRRELVDLGVNLESW